MNPSRRLRSGEGASRSGKRRNLDRLGARLRPTRDHFGAGRRDVELLAADGAGLTRGFPADRRALLGKWFNSCLKGAPTRTLEPEVFAALVDALEEAGRGETDQVF